MSFNENTRVKIPAILHLCRLGYSYLRLGEARWDTETNIFTDLFTAAMARLNPDASAEEIQRLYQDVCLSLDFEDLGKAFYDKLTATSGLRLIDFKNFDNNSFHVVTELPFRNGEEEFRPDITLLINGMPLAFIEVKKPNNHDGILAERERINARFKNKKFRKFINILQLLVFSNHMEYDPEAIEPIQGVFYSTTSYSEANFNYFREEEGARLAQCLQPEDDALENLVLTDTNLTVAKHSPELATNKGENTPTNRVLTSLFCRERLAMLLQYGIAYAKGQSGMEKQVMRYPQLFATLAIEKHLEKGEKRGIIWHTQGSGKTALAYYNVHTLTRTFQRRNIVPKFYFIVDRIDLLNQARREFTSRGLVVQTVSSKEELLASFRRSQAIINPAGMPEITVVNIQKFKEDPDVIRPQDYAINTQRVYFLDEVHRSYDPKGSFLNNLLSVDREAVMIGLTGTPLISGDHKSTEVFGGYIHKYYYNASIADGYTLRLIREGIETEYKIRLGDILNDIQVLEGDLDKNKVYAHKSFVEPMLDYIVRDFVNCRKRFDDDSIGGMVVCDSSDQARMLMRVFYNKYNPEQTTLEPVEGYHAINEKPPEYLDYSRKTEKKLTAALILHDVGSKGERDEAVRDFIAGKIDLLFVYNMLLTGFDARRLKKLYVARRLHDHGLLQMLTRVNRPYKGFRYGFVVDFADISKEFDVANRAYYEELQTELGDEMAHYNNLLKTSEEIESEFRAIKDRLFEFDLNNMEVFSQQISQIEDGKALLEIRKALENARNLYNLARFYGHYDLLERIDFRKFNLLLDETIAHIELLNLRESIQNDVDTTNLLNVALENVIFKFWKRSEEEMIIADRLREQLARTRGEMNLNFDPSDPEFVSLYAELKRLFEKKNLSEISQDEMRENIGALEQIFERVRELNRRNNLLKEKYQQDAKYARVHKQIMKREGMTQSQSAICESLNEVKRTTDERILLSRDLVNAEAYFSQMVISNVVKAFEKIKIALDPATAREIGGLLAREYLNEYQGV